MPTIGHIKVGLADSDTDFASDDFDRDDLVPLVLSREEDALDVRFRFAAMGRIYVSLGLRVTQAAIARVECVDSTLWLTPAALSADICASGDRIAFGEVDPPDS